jgi:glutaminase
MLRNFNILTNDPEPVLDLYFQQCSITVDCRDLAVMAASLANGGVNPLTGHRAVKQDYVENILSVMASCGMYDYAGEWIYRVGMPAKSGVGGGILAVLPGQLGIGVFSPPLDVHGNSIRGLRVCHAISKDFNLHLFNVPHFSKSVIRSKYNATQINSQRLRGAEETKVLKNFGDRIKIYELQGELGFTSVEVVIRDIVAVLDATDFIVVDLKRVVAVDEAACKLLLSLAHRMATKQSALIFANVQHHGNFVQYINKEEKTKLQTDVLVFEDNDFALEWCENQLLARKIPSHHPVDIVPLASHEMCQGLTPRELQHLRKYLRSMTFTTGDLILSSGDPPDNIYLLVKGEVSVTVSSLNGQRKRLSTLSAGMVFGEMAIVNSLPRSADVRADSEVQCYALSSKDFDRFSQSDASLKATLLENLLRRVSKMLRRQNEEISVLAQ